MRPTRRIGTWGLGLLVGGSALAVSGGCRETTADPLPVAVRVERFAAEEVAAREPYSGTIRERHWVTLSFKVAGTVAGLFQVPGAEGRARDVQVGDPVPLGAVLARLDEADYRRSRDGAAERLAQLLARRDGAEAQASHARAEYERTLGLYRRNAATSQELERDESRRLATAAELASATREVAAAQVALAQAEDDLRHCALTVPFAGAVVADKAIEPAERIAAGARAFTLLDVSALKVAFGVPDSRVVRLHPGQAVAVVSDAVRDRVFRGTVTKIAPMADEATRTFPVEVTITDADGLRPGMVVTVELGERSEAYRLPLTAIRRGQAPGDYVVYEAVPDGGRTIARRRRVELDGLSDDGIRIRTGGGTELDPGALVVVRGADRLHDGQVVRVLGTEE